MYLLSRGSGHPILFLHGLPTSCHLWDDVIETLCDAHQCIAVDLPGYGKTPKTASGFRDLRAFAAAIDEIRVKCGVEKWHVVGHDAGCAIATHYAHCFPNRVERLALLSPSIFPDLKPFFLFEILRKPIIGELMAPAISAIFWTLVMRWALAGHGRLKELLRDFQAPFRGWRGSWRLMSHMRWGNPADILASIPQILPQLPAPTLILHGLRDRAVPQTFADRARRMLPNAQVLLINCGHFIPLDRPAVVADELRRFFAREASTPQAAGFEPMPATTSAVVETFEHANVYNGA